MTGSQSATIGTTAVIAATTLNPLAIAALGIEIVGAFMAASQKKKELEVRKQQVGIRAEQDALKRDEKMARIIGQQNVMAAAQGVSASSFSAIERESFEQFAEDKRIADLNLITQTESIETLQSSLFPQAFLSSVGSVTEAYYYANIGSKGSKSTIGKL